MGGFGESAGMDVPSPIPAPNFQRGRFCLHPRPHGGKIPIFGAPNGAISTEIPTNGCKLTSLNRMLETKSRQARISIQWSIQELTSFPCGEYLFFF
jgi:hypothetical protein